MCKFCKTRFHSLLLDQDQAINDTMLALGKHIQNTHTEEYNEAVQKYLVLSRLIQGYLVPNLTGMVGPSLSVDGENPIETRLKELHRLILEGIDPPSIDTQTSTLII